MMKHLMLASTLLFSASVACAQASAPDDASARAPSAPSEQGAPDPQWGPVPPVLPAGAQIAVLQGNPFGDGLYTLRLKMPNGYTVPPHFHPTDEMLTVISGNLSYGHGDKVERKDMTTLRRGGFTTAPAGMHHYVVATGETVVQVHGKGPFSITYVNPADNPQKPATP